MEAYIEKVKVYRDKFVAHLDSELTAHIPVMDDALVSGKHYFKYAADQAITLNSIGGLPTDPESYYQNCFEEALVEYAKKT